MLYIVRKVFPMEINSPLYVYMYAVGDVCSLRILQWRHASTGISNCYISGYRDYTEHPVSSDPKEINIRYKMAEQTIFISLVLRLSRAVRWLTVSNLTGMRLCLVMKCSVI